MLFLDAAISLLLAHYMALRIQPHPQKPDTALEAEAPEGIVSLAQACAEDKDLYCAGTDAEDELKSCLGRNWRSLDPRCQEAIGESPPSPCATEVKRLCPSAPPGPGAGECLDRNSEKLSEPCRLDMIAAGKEHPCYPFLATRGQSGIFGAKRTRFLLEHIDELPLGCVRFLRNSAVIQICSGDAQKFCGRKSGVEVQKCLDSNLTQLSPSCQKFQERSRKAFPCRNEIISFCREGNTTPAERWLCLRKNLAKLSTACKESWQRNAAQFACVDYMEKYCKDVPPRTRRSCMRTHIEKAPPECQQRILQTPPPQVQTPQSQPF